MSRSRVLLCLLALCLPWLAAAAPVEFSFKLARTDTAPFAREVWAEVVAPDGRTLRLPAFLAAGDTWSVRAHAALVGDYRLGDVKETTSAGLVVREATVLGTATHTVREVRDPRGNVGIDPRNPRRFAFADGTPYVPFGANLAWAEGPREKFFPAAFAQLEQAGLNWSRIWMCHWGATNLDWLPADLAPSPEPGSLDLGTAALWDRIVAAAEQHGIYFQMVFQHHGQISTGANANWQLNPWNTANGGFLHSPVAFFSDPRAREITRRKYRYIVARWGYSSSIMAWELFNEAMWTDARNGTAADNAAIAAWHAEMADYVRSVDVHRHLVTTSDDYLTEQLYAKMDYYQPHLYACHLLPSARWFEPAAAALDRPVFYGECGEDNDPRLVDGPKNGGPLTLPILWSSVMADAAAPAQYWYTTDALRNGLLPQFATLARFRRETRLDRRDDLAPFTALVETAEQMPLVIQPALNWRQGVGPTVAVPLDGREPAELAAIPRHFVNADPASGQRFPGRATFQLNYPRAVTASIRLTGYGAMGASFRLSLDGRVLAERTWPATADRQASAQATTFAVPLTAGAHTLTLENPRGEDWFELGGIDTGLTCSPLAAVGRRAADRVCLWVWHRDGVYRKDGATPLTGRLVVESLPAGSWRAIWWDLETGEPQPASEFAHDGGDYRLPTPPIGRHAAVTLELVP
ncbi:MAG TPA: hypothetical protein VK163_11740 [Opitutaceae bacterium]|nr:hypothetical protein [Opitutaceae bacterium]